MAINLQKIADGMSTSFSPAELTKLLHTKATWRMVIWEIENKGDGQNVFISDIREMRDVSAKKARTMLGRQCPEPTNLTGHNGFFRIGIRNFIVRFELVDYANGHPDYTLRNNCLALVGRKGFEGLRAEKPVEQKCGTCRFFRATIDKNGRRVNRESNGRPCDAPVPELSSLNLPDIITKAHNFAWPPYRSLTWPSDGTNCPAWKKFEKEQK